MRMEHDADSKHMQDKLAAIQLKLLETKRVVIEVVKEYKRLREICLNLPNYGHIVARQIASQVGLSGINIFQNIVYVNQKKVN